jgi:hypothetical protein
MNLAERFETAFINRYASMRHGFADEDWQQAWRDGSWERLMLWNHECLLERVAHDLGLEYWSREPFRVDAAFVPKQNTPLGSVPFPLLVAIEHENKIATIKNEIAKLVHIRCLLKVAITYASNKNLKRSTEKIKQHIIELTATLNAHIREDPRSSYLFLVGVVGEGAHRCELEWHGLRFAAGDGPDLPSWRALVR